MLFKRLLKSKILKIKYASPEQINCFIGIEETERYFKYIKPIQ